MLGFALVGCGRISKRYVGNLTKGRIKGARLVAVCDLVESRAKKVGDEHDIPNFIDMHEMMQTMKDKIDVVCILTPSGDHARHTLELAPYGAHIIVEKPMALRLEDADRMIESCDRSGVKLFIVKQNRFNLAVQKLKEAVHSQRFGKIALGTVRVRWCRDQQYYDQASWRGTWAHDGGCLANQAIHHIDLLQWMLGPVESLYAKTATQLVTIEAEDTGVVVLKFTSGALGVIEATTATRPLD